MVYILAPRLSLEYTIAQTIAETKHKAETELVSMVGNEVLISVMVV